MKILSLNELKKNELKTALSLGFFDGIHMGHQRILYDTIDEARKNGWKSAVFTFRTHPLNIITPIKKPMLINTFNEKKALIKQISFDYFVWTDFNDRFRKMIPVDFARDILANSLGAKSIFIGPNYRFGKNAVGSPDDLSEFGKSMGFVVNILPPLYLEDKMVSSTLIRDAISTGDMKRVRLMLGRYYDLSSQFEIINKPSNYKKYMLGISQFPEGKVVPCPGIYAGYMDFRGNMNKCIVFIGYNINLIKNKIYVNVISNHFEKEASKKSIRLFLIDMIKKKREFDFDSCTKKMEEADKVLKEVVFFEKGRNVEGTKKPL